MGTLIGIGGGVGCALMLVTLTARARRRPVDPTPAGMTDDRGLSWPDPSTRPPF
jgi:hypothetical protein